MLLTNLLRPSLIKPHLEAETRREAIGEVLDLLVQDHEVPYAQRNSVFDELLEREGQMGSGMEAGLAIPHATTDRVEDLLCAFGTAPNGIAFDAIDDQPCKAVLLMLIPRSAYDERIHTLETAAEVFGQRGVIDRLSAAKTPQEIYDIIKQAEQQIRR
jgi:mannitol/fructose-specific phosphotransferase system IIA component (Ntr-type)